MSITTLGGLVRPSSTPQPGVCASNLRPGQPRPWRSSCRLAELDEARREIDRQLAPQDRWPELATGQPWPQVPLG